MTELLATLLIGVCLVLIYYIRQLLAELRRRPHGVWREVSEYDLPPGRATKIELAPKEADFNDPKVRMDMDNMLASAMDEARRKADESFQLALDEKIRHAEIMRQGGIISSTTRLDDIEARITKVDYSRELLAHRVGKLERIYQDLSGIEARLRDTLRKRWKSLGLVKPKKEKAPK